MRLWRIGTSDLLPTVKICIRFDVGNVLIESPPHLNAII